MVKLQEGYLIIFPERMVSPFTGMTMTFQCEDQFAIPMTDLQRGIEQAASKGRTVTLQCRKAMEFAQDKSEDAARTKASYWRCRRFCVAWLESSSRISFVSLSRLMSPSARGAPSTSNGRYFTRQ